MKTYVVGLSVLGLLLSTTALFVAAEDPKDEAIKKDRKQIEGTWRAVTLEVDGNKSSDEDARKITVVNGPDGTWTLFSEGNEVGKGTNSFDPTKKPKTIDFTQTERTLASCVLRHRERTGPPISFPCPAASTSS